jgi:hypothetical protein
MAFQQIHVFSMPFSSPNEYHVPVTISVLLESVTRLPEDNYYKLYWDRAIIAEQTVMALPITVVARSKA